ncbi:hypothetical protein HZI31_08035 [Serratia fonticola]|uniref:hypothetical protein n=1 Tax=Serratia fonticola TaxID=47917 RepID=UPI0015C619CB|nr:hypothetical protein [Serratia fonticola]NYA43251.1 hypothetical protein [Serratia fonticola]
MVFTKEEIKEFLIKFGKRVFFPDVSNRISKYVMVAGVTIIAGMNPYSIVLLNWLVDLFNKSNEARFTIPHFSGDRVDYIWGVVLVLTAITHNILYQWMKFNQEKKQSEHINAMEMLAAESDERQAQQRMEADRVLFKKFLEVFPSNSLSAELLKSHDFENSYHKDSTKQIDKFVDEWDTAESKFLDEEIEQARVNLWVECHKFIYDLAMSSGPVMAGPLLRVIPDAYVGNWDYPEWVNEKLKNLNSASSRCYQLHQDFISLCRNKLKC